MHNDAAGSLSRGFTTLDLGPPVLLTRSESTPVAAGVKWSSEQVAALSGTGPTARWHSVPATVRQLTAAEKSALQMDQNKAFATLQHQQTLAAAQKQQSLALELEQQTLPACVPVPSTGFDKSAASTSSVKRYSSV